MSVWDEGLSLIGFVTVFVRTVGVLFSSHRQSGTGSVVVFATCATSPLSQITSKTKKTWREHWVVPIYKKKAVFSASNCRGVHLTAQLSKVAERLLLPMLEPHISHTVALGPGQFAHERSRCEGRGGLPHDVLDSCAQPTRESCCLLFGRFRCF